MYWRKRLSLLWRFIQLIPRAEELENECKQLEQKMHNLELDVQTSPGHKENELIYEKGFISGMRYCIKRFW